MITAYEIRENWRKRSDDLQEQIKEERDHLVRAPEILSNEISNIKREIVHFTDETISRKNQHEAALRSRDVVAMRLNSLQKELAERKQILLKLQRKRSNLAKTDVTLRDKTKQKEQDRIILLRSHNKNKATLLKLQEKVDEQQQLMYSEGATHKRGMEMAERELERTKNQAMQMEAETQALVTSLQVAEQKNKYTEKESKIHHQKATHEGLMEMLKCSDQSIEKRQAELSRRIYQQEEMLNQYEKQIISESNQCDSSDRLVILQEALERVQFVRRSMLTMGNGERSDGDEERENEKVEEEESEKSEEGCHGKKKMVVEVNNANDVPSDLLFTPTLQLTPSSHVEHSWQRWVQKRQEKLDTSMRHSPRRGSRHPAGLNSAAAAVAPLLQQSMSSLSYTSSPHNRSPPRSPPRSRSLPLSPPRSPLPPLPPPPTPSSPASINVDTLLSEINQALTPRREQSRLMQQHQQKQTQQEKNHKKVMSSSPEKSASSGMHHFRQREQQQPSPPPSTPPPSTPSPSTPPPSTPPPPSLLSKHHLSLPSSKKNLIMLVESPEITKEEIHTTQLNSIPMRKSPLSADGGTGDQNVFRSLKLPIEERLAAALSCFGDEVEKVETMDGVPWVESPELFREQEALDKLMPLSPTQLQDEIAQALKFNGNIHSNDDSEVCSSSVQSSAMQEQQEQQEQQRYYSKILKKFIRY